MSAAPQATTVRRSPPLLPGLLPGLALLLLLGGCAAKGFDGNGAPDGGAGGEAGAPVDASAPADARGAADGGPRPDATGAADGGTATCFTSGQDWAAVPFSGQAGEFTAEFDATPSASPIHSVVALAPGAATSYEGLAVIVRFAANGVIDVRRGDGYAAEATLTYVAGSTYHVRLVVNVATHSYSVFVTPPAAAEVGLASGYAFRGEQAAAASLGYAVLHAEPGGEALTVCGLGIAPGQSVTKTVSYTEPATLAGATTCSANGGAVTDLDHTTIYYRINQGPQVTAAIVPATSPAGGGSIDRQVVIAGLGTGSNQVKVWVTATNAQQGESDPTCSEQVTLTLP